MKFNILGQDLQGNQRTFIYDNTANSLHDADGNEIAYPIMQRLSAGEIAATFSKEVPLGKSKDIAILKIQLGLSCNYSCDYCSQRFVERPPETSKKDIQNFIDKLKDINFDEQRGLKIELWGGEPLVYWKTIKPLVEALQYYFRDWTNKPRFSMITNGSLLTREICHWLYINNFAVAISHDGPGQAVRGDDPLEDPAKRQIILDFYKKMHPFNRISFNSMLNKQNPSRKAIYDWFVAFTGDPSVVLGEGSIIDAYDDGGMANVLATKAEHFAFRKQAFNDIHGNNGQIGFMGVVGKIDAFTRSVLSQVPAETLPQKCGMDDPHIVATDLRGNVITCQNVSVDQVSHNGESHFVGTIDKIEEVKITTSTHWSQRPHCSGCPVLHLCSGSCMYLEGENWYASCQNSFTDNVSLFALSLFQITGFVPRFIDAPHLPDERKDIWGDMLTHTEKPKKKSFPIKVVQEKTTVNGAEVFEAAKVEAVNDGE